MDTAQLGLIILAVRDARRAADFYAGAFGWHREVDVGHYVELRLASGFRVGLYERTRFALNTGALPQEIPEGMLAPCELYLYPGDLDEGERRLLQAGARPLSPRAARPWGDEASYWADPDGNVVVLARHSGNSSPS